MNIVCLTANSDVKNFTFDDIYKIFEVQNVIDYVYENNNSWKIRFDDNKNEKNYYFIIDTLYDDAFAHWIFESAIYLPIFNKLKETYPNIKLVLKYKKTYKKLFCDYFNIFESDIVYQLNSCNICFFPSPITSLNDKSITDNYKKQVCNFRTFFQKDSEIKYENIIMPRQIKENYKGNERRYFFTQKLLSLKNSYILNTDNIIDLKDQINAVQSGKNIIITEGSPFLVNGLFCKNKSLYIIDAFCCVDQEHVFDKIKFIFGLYREENIVSYISQSNLINKLSS
jgi:hypothetical protein